MTVLDDLATAMQAVSGLVHRIRTDQWTAVTPCPDWDVRTLLRHLVDGNWFFAALPMGCPPEGPQAEEHAALDADAIEAGTLVAGYDASAAAVLRAFGGDSVLRSTYRLPIGSLTGAETVSLRLVETVVHGWDLAVATHARVEVADAAVEHALSFTQQWQPELPDGHEPFARAHPVPGGAPPLERLLALLGRDPGGYQPSVSSASAATPGAAAGGPPSR